MTPSRGSRRRRGAVVAALFVGLAAAPLAACGDTEDLDFCTVYADMLEQQAAMEALDAETLTAEDASEVVEDYLTSVRQLLNVSDGRYNSTISQLEVAVNDVLLTLESVQKRADYATWQPLVAEDLETAAEFADQLEADIGTSCDTGS